VTVYYLATFSRRDDGTLTLRFGKIGHGFIASYDRKTRTFHTERLIGRMTLPRGMTADEAREWVNSHFSVLREKFPGVPEFAV
jgi:hypothetical protein